MRNRQAEQQEEVAEFPVTLEEFLTELPAAQVETKAGFQRLMHEQQIGGSKNRSEWAALLDLYQRQPTSMSWEAWTKSQEKGGN